MGYSMTDDSAYLKIIVVHGAARSLLEKKAGFVNNTGFEASKP